MSLKRLIQEPMETTHEALSSMSTGPYSRTQRKWEARMREFRIYLEDCVERRRSALSLLSALPLQLHILFMIM